MDSTQMIYKMKLHEQIGINNMMITRVPGGWMYREMRLGDSCFVPFNEEFKNTLK
jgi:hypothetical protein